MLEKGSYHHPINGWNTLEKKKRKKVFIIVWGVDSILGWDPKALKAHTRKDRLDLSLWIIKGSDPLDNYRGVLDILPIFETLIQGNKHGWPWRI